MSKRQEDFWKDEHCHYCKSPIKEKRTDLTRKYKRKYVLIEKVPTGVCIRCGTRYYAASVLKEVEQILRGRRKAKREMRVPVYSMNL